MSHNPQLKSESQDWISWTLWILGSVLVAYLLSFSMLVLFPQVRQAVRAIGLSPDTVETIYYPIIRLLDR